MKVMFKYQSTTLYTVSVVFVKKNNNFETVLSVLRVPFNELWSKFELGKNKIGQLSISQCRTQNIIQLS